ncbi:hydroxyisourate hydrolase [Paracoccus fistulariae]|uniref:5-hydroxyisourate hydrolase n=1 Tax=Paracoccus fistulariae TaxID=658446 RepID=A0ABY7SK39_9RHOB|nr:hydroxyisourate hydrolase [Paracoccus fistulariae]MDB6181010.1 hydroxyisourate hydrolase [Paracoccus fistulariae]WCR06306.1 hydroxyisourate hydrolase [Paracoccus fistulariae]
MIYKALLATAAVIFVASPLWAEDISTHVLNTATGQGGGGVPVTLEINRDGEWSEIATATTEENGRVEAFGIEAEVATYRLSFDMTAYDGFEKPAFFPEISVVFAVQDSGRHHHVPVLVSPFGYSTYLGN